MLKINKFILKKVSVKILSGKSLTLHKMQRACQPSVDTLQGASIGRDITALSQVLQASESLLPSLFQARLSPFQVAPICLVYLYQAA